MTDGEGNGVPTSTPVPEVSVIVLTPTVTTGGSDGGEFRPAAENESTGIPFQTRVRTTAEGKARIDIAVRRQEGAVIGACDLLAKSPSPRGEVQVFPNSLEPQVFAGQREGILLFDFQETTIVSCDVNSPLRPLLMTIAAGTIAIKGTAFTVVVDQEGDAEILVSEGLADFEAEPGVLAGRGSFEVRAGQELIIRPGEEGVVRSRELTTRESQTFDALGERKQQLLALPTPRPQDRPPDATPTPVPTPTPALPSAAAVLSRVLSALEDTASFHYEAEIQLDVPTSGASLPVTIESSGDFQAPDRSRGTVSVTVILVGVEFQFVLIGDENYVTDTDTGEWQLTGKLAVPFADPHAFVGAEVLGSIERLALVGEEVMDGGRVYHLKGLLPAGALGDEAGAGEFQTDLWVGADDALVRRLTARGSIALQGGEVAGVELEGDADVRVFLKISDFGKSVTIVAPLVAP